MSAWMWPQWFMAIFLALEMAATLYMNGKPKTGTHNGAVNLCWWGGIALVLHLGGFWS